MSFDKKIGRTVRPKIPLDSTAADVRSIVAEAETSLGQDRRDLVDLFMAMRRWYPQQFKNWTIEQFKLWNESRLERMINYEDNLARYYEHENVNFRDRESASYKEFAARKRFDFTQCLEDIPTTTAKAARQMFDRAGSRLWNNLKGEPEAARWDDKRGKGVHLDPDCQCAICTE